MVTPLCESLCGATPVSALFVAGEIEFADLTASQIFTFDQVGDTFNPIPVGDLNPASNLFISPSPGVLQYVGGAPLRIRASYSIAFLWVFVSQDVFSTILLLNDVPVEKTQQAETLSGPGIEAYGHTSDGLLVLQPGDRLQLAVSATTPGSHTIVITALTIVANKV